MLLKLLKYDFRAMWKQFSLIWGAALVLALATRFTLFVPKITYYETYINGTAYGGSVENGGGTSGNLLLLAFICVIIAMFVLSIVFIVGRFSKGLLGDEGYLMHTLPVRPWELVTSKLICGVAVCAVSGIAALLSMCLMTPVNLLDVLGIRELYQIFRGLIKHPDMLALAVEFCLMLLSGLIQFITVVYLAIAVGHLFSRHRRLVSVAAFIGLYILLVNIYDRVFSARITQRLMDAATATTHGSMLTGIAVVLIPAAVFLAAVCWILENKLNLE